MRASRASAMQRRRSAAGAVAGTGTMPQSRMVAGSVAASSNAYPIPVVPGSTPRMTLGGLEDFLRHVEVRVHLLHVVELLERLDEPDHLLRLVALEAHGGRRTHGHLGVVDRQ